MDWLLLKFRSYWLWVVAGAAILGAWLAFLLRRDAQRRMDTQLRTRVSEADHVLDTTIRTIQAEEAAATESVLRDASAARTSMSSTLPSHKTAEELTEYLKSTGTAVRGQ